MTPRLLTCILVLTAGCYPWLSDPYTPLDDTGGSDDTGGLDDTGIDLHTCGEDGGIVVGLSRSGDLEADTTWTEGGVTVSVEAIDSAFYAEGVEGCIWVGPAQVVVSTEGLDCVVERVEFDVIDYCGSGCTTAVAYAGDSEVAEDSPGVTGSTVTLELPSSQPISSAAAESWEAAICEIRLY